MRIVICVLLTIIMIVGVSRYLYKKNIIEFSWRTGHEPGVSYAETTGCVGIRIKNTRKPLLTFYCRRTPI